MECEQQAVESRPLEKEETPTSLISDDWRAPWRGIDWDRPWLQSVAAVGKSLAMDILQGMPVHAALNRALPPALREQGLQFVSQEALPAGAAYEAHIRHQRCIPTRDNLHDFFNGLVWLHWPRLKLHLNALQAQEIVRDGVGAHRGPLRDALTVLDENGAIWFAPSSLISALQNKQWQVLMVEQRSQWSRSAFLPVGHALMEKLVHPRKPMCAHVLCIPTDGTEFAGVHMPNPEWADEAMQGSSYLEATFLRAKPFSPLPVLGIPGWWQENENFSFYDDSFVFRGPRSSNITTTEERQR